MEFVAISIDQYIKKYLDNKPGENEGDFRKRINSAMADYKIGVKCLCGNEICVIGSASAGNSCFTCITGESQPDGDYEIDSIVNAKNKKGRRHIDDIDPTKIAGFFDDEGYEINTDLIKKPGLCITCVHDTDPDEEILCQMTRHDQRKDPGFKCFAYKRLAN
jgi:hypothetical protein